MILDFTDADGPRHFEFCFQGFILGGSMTEHKKNISILRRELSLLEKLEGISQEKPCGKKLPTGEPDRQLVDGEITELKIHIEGIEFDLLYNYISEVPWQTGKPLKHAIETIDWLIRCQKISS